MSRPFSAKYAGQCRSCLERFHAGDAIRFDEEFIVHEDCESPDVEAHPDARPAGPTCPHCFLELPTSGTCGVCE